MSKYKKGIPWLNFESFAPKLYLNEKNEKIIKWVMRGITIIGIIASVISLDWYFSLSLAILLVLIDLFLEKTIFYYTSMYVTSLPTFEYEPDKWIANSFVSLGSPEDPNSQKILGLVFNDKEYAGKLFNLFRAWNEGSSDNKLKNIKMSFIIDENAYFVYLYPNFGKESIRKMHQKVVSENKVKKYGKQHLGLIMGFILCKEFSTKHGFGLGDFINNHPNDKPFLLGAFSLGEGKNPSPITEIDPIKMYAYKAKIASELTENDFEYHHWHSLVDRTSIG